MPPPTPVADQVRALREQKFARNQLRMKEERGATIKKPTANVKNAARKKPIK